MSWTLLKIVLAADIVELYEGKDPFSKFKIDVFSTVEVYPSPYFSV